VVKEFVSDVIRRQSQIRYAHGEPLRQQLESYAHGVIELVRNPEHLRLFRAILAEHVRDPALVQAAVSTDWESEYGFDKWVAAAHRDGRLAVKNARSAAHIFSSLMRGLITWPVLLARVELTSDRLPSEVSEAIDMFLSYFEPRGRSRENRTK
jgi:hypothetical protein